MSLDLIFDLLNNYGDFFNQDFWKTIFNGVIKPLIDTINYLYAKKSKMSRSEKKKRRAHLK
jgi:hypothetical protein